MPEAITTTWEHTIVQRCIVHLIRGSFRYAGRQHRDAIIKSLKPVYTAPSEAAAKERFTEFAAEWGQRYPAIVRLWENSWAEVVPFLEYDVEVRRVICSTDEIVKRELVSWVSSGPPELRRHARLARPRSSPRCVVVCRYRPRGAGRNFRGATVRRRRVRACAVCG